MSVDLFQLSPAAAACGGFAAVGPAARTIVAWPAPSSNGAAAAKANSFTCFLCLKVFNSYRNETLW